MTRLSGTRFSSTAGAPSQGHWTMDRVQQFFSDDFMPHGMCYMWQPEILWLHVLSDALIGLAYFSIPVALYIFASRRKDMEYRWMFFLFTAFITLCGATHFLNIVIVWIPLYGIEGLLKLATGLVSAVTAVMLWPLIPKALALPSPASYRLQNRQLEAEIGSRMAAERDLKELNENLEQLVEDLGTSKTDLKHFADVAFQKLKAPWEALSGLSALVSDRHRGEDDAEAAELLRQSAAAEKELRALVNSIGELANDERRPMEFRQVDMEEVLSSVLTALKEPIARSGAQIVHDPLPKVSGDRARLTRLLQNLLSNAIAFQKPGIVPEIRVSAIEQEKSYLFAVKDNGTGISTRYWEQIFLPFKQAHGETEDKGSGKGIGLSVCKQVIEAHGGRIWVSSEQGKGSTFYFLLPNQAVAA